MEMANQMLSEIKAANKRKTLDGVVTPSTSSTANSKPSRVSKHDDSVLAERMNQVSLNQQKPLASPQQQQKQQVPTSSQQQLQNIPVGRIQTSPPPILPTHGQPYHPQQYPMVSNDLRYQQQQLQGRPQSPYHSPTAGKASNMRPVYNQPPSQMEVVPRVCYCNSYFELCNIY